MNQPQFRHCASTSYAYSDNAFLSTKYMYLTQFEVNDHLRKSSLFLAIFTFFWPCYKKRKKVYAIMITQFCVDSVVECGVTLCLLKQSLENYQRCNFTLNQRLFLKIMEGMQVCRKKLSKMHDSKHARIHNNVITQNLTRYINVPKV